MSLLDWGENMRAPLLNNDAARVAALHRYGILDSAPEPAYEEISKLAAQICDCPVATIGFIDDRRHWAKSRCGLPRDEKPRELSICKSTVCQSDLLLVPDLAADERFSGYSTVAGKPHFRFYCGMPLINPEGFALGTLCVMDFQPRQLSFAQTEAVRCLAHQVSTQLELRRKLLELEEAHRQIELERAEGERLLANILPKEIADELRHEGRVKPRYYQAVTILFSDFVGFTKLAEMLEPNELIAQLDDYFSAFDRIVERHRLEKIKTIGDAYMAVGGLPVPNHTHPYDAALAALEISHHAEGSERHRMGVYGWVQADHPPRHISIYIVLIFSNRCRSNDPIERRENNRPGDEFVELQHLPLELREIPTKSLKGRSL